MKLNFAVKANSIHLYQAFKSVAEDLGWQWNSKFNQFSLRSMERTSCVFFSKDWNGHGPMMSFSNPGVGTTVFNLDTQWGEAVEWLKKITLEEPKKTVKISADYSAVVTKNSIQVGCQIISKTCFLDLFKSTLICNFITKEDIEPLIK